MTVLMKSSRLIKLPQKLPVPLRSTLIPAKQDCISWHIVSDCLLHAPLIILDLITLIMLC